MAVTYTCDRCGTVLDGTDTGTGAHRIVMVDEIPWRPGRTTFERLQSPTVPGHVDLCDDCCRSFVEWLKPPVAKAKAGIE